MPLRTTLRFVASQLQFSAPLGEMCTWYWTKSVITAVPMIGAKPATASPDWG